MQIAIDTPLIAEHGSFQNFVLNFPRRLMGMGYAFSNHNQDWLTNLTLKGNCGGTFLLNFHGHEAWLWNKTFYFVREATEWLFTKVIKKLEKEKKKKKKKIFFFMRNIILTNQTTDILDKNILTMCVIKEPNNPNQSWLLYRSLLKS